MSQLQNDPFKLVEGTKVTVPPGAAQHFKKPSSKPSAGETLPLVAFLQEAPGNTEGAVKQFCFTTKNTGGRGLKCFMANVSDGETVEIVMVHTNDSELQSAAMVLPEQVDSFMASYNTE